ncbi:hypothetical protein LX32DRAFT_399550 [Colletotrichum zoysiae]|uniref:Uncharacterized protein n=1 Tax=Colletotrichum zoysiae TaxID=1216348 RepID=A0AAD9HIK6_9PEZI|nr:hypothetical protein LX32DRAFT_399550 [Colletotrichum zoysiae]
MDNGWVAFRQAWFLRVLAPAAAAAAAAAVLCHRLLLQAGRATVGLLAFMAVSQSSTPSLPRRNIERPRARCSAGWPVLERPPRRSPRNDHHECAMRIRAFL